ncbi:MAG: amidohydrolase family protein [Oscillospiraceae bacterium]|nr:amidohydrolase family protein [Oscillospiraceae bacterium]
MRTVIVGRMADVLRGELIPDAAVLVDGARIVYAGPAEDAPKWEEAQVLEARDGLILPGFIDCHAHLTGFENDYVLQPDAVLALKAVNDMRDLLAAGFTAVRDMSRISPWLKRGVESGWVTGPHIMAGSQVLSVTAGHADEAHYPWEIARDTSLSAICDGVDECLKTVRMQFRRGAEFIKVCATGGVSSMADGLDDIQFSREEMQAIVDEAARHGSYVAAHCSGVAGAKQALQCGVKTIEHGIQLDDECIEIMKRNDCSLVTTLYVSLNVANMAGLPDWLIEKGRLCSDRNRQSIAKAHAAGINIALGTDFGNGGPNANTDFSFIGREFAAITECGFTNMEAIQIGTINGARCMGRAEDLGSLTAGKFADIVICRGNPIDDIHLLGSAGNIRFVMKAGVVQKNILCEETLQ